MSQPSALINDQLYNVFFNKKKFYMANEYFHMSSVSHSKYPAWLYNYSNEAVLIHILLNSSFEMIFTEANVLFCLYSLAFIQRSLVSLLVGHCCRQ